MVHNFKSWQVKIAKLKIEINKTESKFSPKPRPLANPYLHLLNLIKTLLIFNLINFTTNYTSFRLLSIDMTLTNNKTTFSNHHENATITDAVKFLDRHVHYNIYISMLRLQSYDGIKYLSVNYKYKCWFLNFQGLIAARKIDKLTQNLLKEAFSRVKMMLEPHVSERFFIIHYFPLYSPCETGWRKAREIRLYKKIVQKQVFLILFSLSRAANLWKVNFKIFC